MGWTPPEKEGETHNNQIDHGGWVGVGSGDDNDSNDGGPSKKEQSTFEAGGGVNLKEVQ